VRSLEDGEGREETLNIYRKLMQLTRSVRDEEVRAFIACDVGERATAHFSGPDDIARPS
jgi:hypothetical protein